MSATPSVLLVHNSPSGRLHINHIGEVDPGVPFEAPADVAERLLEQSDVFSIAKTSKGADA